MEDIKQAILKRLPLVILVPLVLVIIAVGVSFLQTPVYEASTQMWLEPEWGTRWETDTPGIQLIPPAVWVPRERALKTMEAIDKPAIAKETIRRLGLSGQKEKGELLDNLTTSQDLLPAFELSYKDTNPQRAQRVANTVAEVASERIRKETPYDYDLQIRVMGEASLPRTPVSPDPVRNAIVALALGLVLGIGLALLMERRSFFRS